MKIIPFFGAGVVMVLLAGTATSAVVQRQTLHGHVPAAVANLTATSRLPATTNLHLAISLPLRNQDALTNLLRQIYDPASTNFHHYLTPEQFAANFGPSPEDYQAVSAFMQAHGLTVTATHPNRVVLDVAGSVTNIEQAFHVTLRMYQHPKEARKFYAPDVEPSPELAVPILHINGLDNYALPRPHLHTNSAPLFKNAKPRTGSGPGSGYMGKDFRAAYFPNYPLTGSGQSVGLLQFDGYTASDITYYETLAGLPNVTLTNVLLNGVSGQPSGGGGEVEVSLDIEMAISMAPGLDRVIVYEGGDWYDILNRMATDNLAKQLSCSWYMPGAGADPTADAIWQQMAAQGQSFYNASGDADAFVGEPDFPSESPYITQVGGTTLTTSGPGGTWQSETVWNWGGGTGSGGGISTYYSLPVWQQGISMTNNQGSTTFRNIPDVALTADNVYVRADGADYNAGGTSCAAPLWAGLTALINQLALTNGQPAVGLLNPTVYAFGKSQAFLSGFHDIATGNNESPTSPTKFTATNGYDLCTGWGTPLGSNLLYAIGVPEPLRIAPLKGVVFQGPVGGPFIPASQSFTLTNSGTAALSWSLLSTSVWIYASPTGGSLTPGGSAASVNLSASVTANSLPPGSYSGVLWFTNLTDDFGQSRPFTVAVVTPPVITAQPKNQAVLEGMTATFTVTTAANALMFYQWRDNGTNLTDGPNLSGTGSSTLTISSVSPTNVGTYSVIVSNAAGSQTSSNALLTIIPSAPVIVQQPTNQTILPGAPVTFTVAAVGDHPFTYRWQQNGNNLKDGVNLSGAATSALTISNVATANAGNYTVLVSNALGYTTSTGAVLTVVSITAPGVTFTPLVSFADGNSGKYPYSPLAPGLDGKFYGTTYEGGTNDCGTAFKVTTNGALTTLVQFNYYNNGGYPYAGLAADTKGNFYGMASSGGSNYDGTVFKMTSNGALTTLLSLNYTNGYFPVGGLARGKDGNFYGTTYQGGANGYGIVFKVTANGALTVLHSFNYTDGGYPSSVLIQAADGNFYGTTENGGPTGWGTVFKITPAGRFTVLHSFTGNDGGIPVPGLVQDTDGSLYGTTYYGGTSFDGTIFKITTDGTFTNLYSFTGGTDGASPWGGLLLGNDGNLYGTTQSGGTYNYGTVFRLAPRGALVTLVQFDGYIGATPGAALVTGADGNLYGTTIQGGANNDGTIYQLNISGPLQITGQPVNQTAFVGGSASFNVATFGSQPVFYQWRKNGVALTNGTNVSGATSRTLTLTNIAIADAGYYSVIVSNASDKVTSASAVLEVTVSPPFIVSEPDDQTLLAGATAVFDVEAGGDLPLSYQWQFNGTNLTDGGNITGSATSELTVRNLSSANSGNYSVLVSDDLGTVASDDAALTVVPITIWGINLNNLHMFGNATTGLNPNGLMQGTNGFLYGTAQNGGANNDGTVFRITTNGAFATLASFNFNNGAMPLAGLVQGNDGNFYGTALEGGSNYDGNIFKVTPAGVLTTVYSFTGGTDGSYPVAGLAKDAAGNFYGTTEEGGTNGYGAIFKITPGGALTRLHSFAGSSDGAYPYAALVRGPDGFFYGTTVEGGTHGFGTVFKISSTGTFTNLYSFADGSDGAYPFTELTPGSTNNNALLYGTTYSGGTNSDGTVFSMTTNGALTTLFWFTGDNGAAPSGGLVAGTDGNLYGTTETAGLGGVGTVFKLTPNGALTTLIWFNGINGANPQAALVQATDGSFYGTTYAGGSAGNGTVFRFTLPTAPNITGQPTNQTAFAGTTVTFNVTATGTAPLTWQWQQNGTNLTDDGEFSGTATGTLTISNLTPADAGIYSVTVSNNLGSVTSTGAVLTVVAMPAITLQPTNLTVLQGQTATFTAAATGGIPLFYQWQFNGTNLTDGGNVSGSTTTNLVISNVSATNGGIYCLTVTNTYAATTSSNAVLTFTPVTLPGTTLDAIASFLGGTNGANPNGLTLGANGIFYGTTQHGGTNSSGTVFQFAVGGTPGTLYSFTGGDGNVPLAGVAQDVDGSLYGTTVFGGTNGNVGAAFRITTNGALTSLHSFTEGADGGFPYAGFVRGNDGNFYGTTYEGGLYNDNGTVFSITTNGTFTSLYSFTGGGDGADPSTALVLGADGNFYGTTEEGGTNGGWGTVFMITTNGTLTSLHSFSGGSEGGYPEAPLAQGNDGVLYGTTQISGPANHGTLFKITTNGTFTLLYTFTGGSDGGAPSGGLVQGGDGNFYGTTSSGGVYGDGTVFQITPSGTLTTLAWFDGYNGANPAAALALGPDGYFYGTTQNGGINGAGAIFRLVLPPPVIPLLQTAMQPDGTLALTWTAQAGRSYQLQYNSDMTSTNWINLGSPINATTNAVNSSDVIGADAQRFYRAVLLP